MYAEAGQGRVAPHLARKLWLRPKYLGGHFGSISGVLVAKDADVGERLAYIQNATGAILGHFDSLVCHPASMTHASIPKEQRLRGGITDGLLRLSVGLESVEDLKADLAQALGKA